MTYLFQVFVSCVKTESERYEQRRTQTPLTTLSHKAMGRVSAIKQEIRNVTYVGTLYLTKGQKRTRQMFPFCDTARNAL